MIQLIIYFPTTGHSFAFATSATISRIFYGNVCKGILPNYLQSLNEHITFPILFALVLRFLFLSATNNLSYFPPQDPKLLKALVENHKRSFPYAGAFLVKNEEDTDSNTVTRSDPKKSIHGMKGKELLKHLHEIGTLAKVFSYLPGLGDSIETFIASISNCSVCHSM